MSPEILIKKDYGSMEVKNHVLPHAHAYMHHVHIYTFLLPYFQLIKSKINIKSYKYNTLESCGSIHKNRGIA